MNAQTGIEELKEEAQTLIDSGNPERAVWALRSLLANNHADAASHALMGAALSMLGNSRQSVVHLQEAICLEPDEPSYRHTLGEECERRGDLAGAIGAFRAAVERDPEDGIAAAQLKRLMTAASDAEKPESQVASRGRNTTAPDDDPESAARESRDTPMETYSAPVTAPKDMPGNLTELNSPDSDSSEICEPFGAAEAEPSHLSDVSAPAAPTGRSMQSAPRIVRHVRSFNFLTIAFFLADAAALSLTAFGGIPGLLAHPYTLSILSVSTIDLLALTIWVQHALPRGGRAIWFAEIVICLLGMLAIPFGTVVSGYILYNWTRTDSRDWFSGDDNSATS